MEGVPRRVHLVANERVSGGTLEAKEPATTHDRGLDSLKAIPAIDAAVCINDSSEKFIHWHKFLGVGIRFLPHSGFSRAAKICSHSRQDERITEHNLGLQVLVRGVVAQGRCGALYTSEPLGSVDGRIGGLLPDLCPGSLVAADVDALAQPLAAGDLVEHKVSDISTGDGGAARRQGVAVNTVPARLGMIAVCDRGDLMRRAHDRIIHFFWRFSQEKRTIQDRKALQNADYKDQPIDFG